MRARRGGRSAARTRILLVLIAVPAALAAAPPPRTIAPPESVVRDGFIGYFLSLLRYDFSVDMTGEELLRIFPEYENDTESPIRILVRFQRLKEGDRREVDVLFDGPLARPAPLDIFGLKPVMLRGTPSITVREEHLRVTTDDAASIASAYMLFIESGTLAVDFAPWLDFLLGSIVDDVDVDVVYALEYAGTWYGVMAGYNPAGRPVTGVYDMRHDRFVARPARAIVEFALAHLRPVAATE